MMKVRTLTGRSRGPTQRQRPFPIDDDDPRRSIGSTSDSASFVDDADRGIDTNSIAGSSSSRRASAASARSLNHDLPVPPYDEDNPWAQAATRTSIASDISVATTDEDEEVERRRRRARNRRQADSLRGLQAIAEANGGPRGTSSGPAQQAPFAGSLFGVDSAYAKRMEEFGRMRRLQSQSHLAPVLKSPQAALPDGPPPPLPPSASAKGAAPADDASVPSAPGSSGRPRPESEFLPAYSSPTNATFADAAPMHVPVPVPEPEPALEPPPVSPPVPPKEDVDPQIQLARVLNELEATKEAMAQAAAAHEEDKRALFARLAASEEQTALYKRSLAVERAALADMRSDLEQVRGTLTSLTLEKRGWQGKLDAMHHKAQHAERIVRTLDHLTRAKLEVREAGAGRSIRRSKHLLSVDAGPSMEVVGEVAALNEEILQLANIFVENLQRTTANPSAQSTQRAKFVIGEGMTKMMEAQANNGEQGFHFLLVQVALQVFMTSWCSSIIDGNYPQQLSFTDLLLEMSAQSLIKSSRRGDVARIHCGHPIQVLHATEQSNITTKFREWVDDIVDDLGQILLVGGLKVRTPRSHMFTEKLLGLVKMAYDLRAALAERDICGGLMLCTVAPDTPFQPKWMDEAHEGDVPLSELQTEPIAGTCEIGLQRHSLAMQYTGQNRGESSRLDIVLKPKVARLSILDEP